MYTGHLIFVVWNVSIDLSIYSIDSSGVMRHGPSKDSVDCEMEVC